MRSKLGSKRAQSAIEYLVTYSWAIIVVAVALISLFAYGIFNSNFFVPKAPPGSCYVFRPYGPHTTQLAALSGGACNGEQPRYITTFNSIAQGQVAIPSVSLNGLSQLTLSEWVFPTPLPQRGQVGSMTSSSSACPYGVDLEYLQPNRFEVEWTLSKTDSGNSCTDNFMQSSYPTNRWYFLAFTFNGVAGTLYVNGVSVNSLTPAASPDTIWAQPGFFIGSNSAGNYFSGSMADVQLYNISLPSSYIGFLYKEGIAGVPVDLQNLVGWWPLNGNADDYSGDNISAVSTNILFSSAISNYSAP
jgi:hypothetical protein